MVHKNVNIIKIKMEKLINQFNDDETLIDRILRMTDEEADDLFDWMNNHVPMTDLGPSSPPQYNRSNYGTKSG